LITEVALELVRKAAAEDREISETPQEFIESCGRLQS
jgi:hypothetical protein